jgi:hypothetical protein
MDKASHLAFHHAWVLSEAALAYRSLAGNLHLVSRPSAIDCTKRKLEQHWSPGKFYEKK